MKRGVFRFVAVAAVCLALGGCAARGAGEVYDPLEPVNRYTHELNRFLQFLLLNPAAEVWRETVPKVVRDRITGVADLLTTPLDVAHNVLQADFADAARGVGRFVVNATVGVGGLFDPATRLGLKADDEDLGQTLARWGVPPGPYIVLPGFGPSTLRDGLGRVGDLYADPVGRATENDPDAAALDSAVGAIGALDAYATIAPLLENVERQSVDPYVSLRTFYYGARANAVRDGADAPEDASPALDLDDDPFGDDDG